MNICQKVSEFIVLTLACIAIFSCNGSTPDKKNRAPHYEPAPDPAPKASISAQLFKTIESGDIGRVVKMGKDHPVEFEAPFQYKKYPAMTPLQFALATNKDDIALAMLSNFAINQLNPWHRVLGDNAIETVLERPPTEKLYRWMVDFANNGDEVQVKYLLSDPETKTVLRRHKDIWTALKNRKLTPVKEEIKIIRPIGITNGGNRCYADSAMQILMLMPEEFFTIAKTTYKKVLDQGKIPQDRYQFLQDVFLFRETWTSGAADQESLKDRLQALLQSGLNSGVLQYKSRNIYAQEDAHELLAGITQYLGDTSFPHFKETSTITWMRDGKSKSSVTTDILPNGLNLPLEDPTGTKPFPDGITLQQVLDQYYAPSLIDPTNKYRDPDDGMPVDAEQTLGLQGHGDYLFMTLKRFHVDFVKETNTSTARKIDTKVNFEDGEVEIGTYMTPIKSHQKFALIGVALHSGPNITGGHYIAKVKYGDQWFEANDSSISETTWDQVKSEAAGQASVMLFKRVK